MRQMGLDPCGRDSSPLLFVFFNKVLNYSDTNLKADVSPATGLGIRCVGQRINFRLDYARGLNDNGGLYFHVTEAF